VVERESGSGHGWPYFSTTICPFIPG
jgi:hypothetical protein